MRDTVIGLAQVGNAQAEVWAMHGWAHDITAENGISVVVHAHTTSAKELSSGVFTEPTQT